ncbi:hypothetical protein ACFX15_036492 [Malus domestica]
MVSGYLNANRVSEAIELSNSMPPRNTMSWTTMVTGLAQNKMARLAREYFDRMPNKDVVAWNAMITYVDEGLVAEASELFCLMRERNIVTWNVMIGGYAKSGAKEEALKHLIFMLQFCFKPNGTIMTSVLSSSEGMMELMQAHLLVICHGNTLVANVLIDMYARNGDVTSVRHVFEHLGDNKDAVSWAAMILAFSNHGYGHHALQVFVQMLRSGAKPDGLVDEAAQVEVVCRMPACKQDAAVLGALLGAHKLRGDVTMANCIGKRLVELEPASSGAC